MFLTDDQEVETAANAPFERVPDAAEGPSRGVLFVHGLGYSPFIFRDLAERMAADGFIVRTILLPGHGSKPGDLTLPAFDDWSAIASHHAGLLAREVDELSQGC